MFMLKAGVFFTGYSSGHRRQVLADALETDDPFGLALAEMIERVLAAGFRRVEPPKTESWCSVGKVSEIERDGQTFPIAVIRDAQEISLQDIRADPSTSIE